MCVARVRAASHQWPTTPEAWSRRESGQPNHGSRSAGAGRALRTAGHVPGLGNVHLIGPRPGGVAVIGSGQYGIAWTTFPFVAGVDGYYRTSTCVIVLCAPVSEALRAPPDLKIILI